MINDEWLKTKGEFKIKVINKITKEIIKEDIIKNRIMNAALNKFANILIGEAPDMQIAYFAVGDDNTAVTDTDTTLGNETFRTALVDGYNTGTGQVTTEFYLIDSESVGTIEEVGIFCGSTATASADTGILLARILWTHEKTSLEEIQITRVDTIAR